MMDGETVQNMYSVVLKQNKFEVLCIWLVLLQKYITMHGPTNTHEKYIIYINEDERLKKVFSLQTIYMQLDVLVHLQEILNAWNMGQLDSIIY
jgi:hypothetical protein